MGVQHEIVFVLLLLLAVLSNVSHVYCSCNLHFLIIFVQAATRCDSMTLTPGQWLGLPAVTAVTLYRHEDPALVGTYEYFTSTESYSQSTSI